MAIKQTISLIGRQSNSTLYSMALAGLILLIPMKIGVDRAFARSGYPRGFVESQLSFNGESIRNDFRQMDGEQMIRYRQAQYVDYLFLTVYGFAFFSFALATGRLLSEISIIPDLSLIFAITALIAALCDALENFFILLMIANADGFPDSYATLHSFFAASKFILIGTNALFIVFGLALKGFLLANKYYSK